MIIGMIIGRWGKAGQVLLWMAAVVYMLYWIVLLWLSELLWHCRLADVHSLVWMNSVGLTISLLPNSLWVDWVGVLVARLLMGAHRRREAHPLLMMDAISWGEACHHSLWLEGLAVH